MRWRLQRRVPLEMVRRFGLGMDAVQSRELIREEAVLIVESAEERAQELGGAPNRQDSAGRFRIRLHPDERGVSTQAILEFVVRDVPAQTIGLVPEKRRRLTCDPCAVRVENQHARRDPCQRQMNENRIVRRSAEIVLDLDPDLYRLVHPVTVDSLDADLFLGIARLTRLRGQVRQLDRKWTVDVFVTHSRRAELSGGAGCDLLRQKSRWTRGRERGRIPWLHRARDV